MGFFSAFFEKPPSAEEKARLLGVALNAVMANHKLCSSDDSTLKLIAELVAVSAGADRHSPPSMQNATADLTYIPRVQQMFLVSQVCAIHGIEPEIEDMSWYSVPYVEGVRDRQIANAIATIQNQCGVSILWPKASIDFQALYYRGLNIDYGMSLQFITANDAD